MRIGEDKKKSNISYQDEKSVSSFVSSTANFKPNKSDRREKSRKNKVEMDEKQQLELIISDNMKKMEQILYSEM